MAFWPRKSGDTAPDGMAPLAPPAAPQAPAAMPAMTTAPAAPPAASAGSTPAAETPQISPEQMKKMAEASKRISAAFGEIVSIFMRTPAYAKMPLSDLESIVVPAVATGQFTLAEGQSKANGLVHPVGVVLWARVSDEVDGRMSQDPAQPARLKPVEWSSGDKVWVMEALGDPRVVEAMLKKMSETAWAGRTVKFRTRNKDGQAVIATLPTVAGQSS